MREVWKKFKNLMFHESYEIQHKLLNLILLAAVVGGTISLISCIAIGMDIVGNAVVALLLVVVSIALYMSVIKKKPVAAAVLVVLMANMVIFPVMYIYSGGMNSGMPIWFVLGLIFSWLILKGRVCYTLYVLNVVSLSATIYIGYCHPEIIKSLSPEAVALDVIQSMVIVSSIFGTIFKYQTYVYEKQRKYLMEREEMLSKTLEELRKANQAKSDFLANMSHEIRTPINAVLGMDEMILRENANKDIERYALNIQSAGQTLLSLINDILDFSKIESGKMEILPVEYDVMSLIHDCYNMIYMRASEKNLQLHVKNNPEIPAKLYGDEIRIRQIIVNLLTNAVKYTPKGFVDFEIDWSPIERDRMLLMVSVKDSGMGISKENQEQLFVSFLRIEESKNRSIEGTGLGLTITKQLIDLMHGTITVESEPGQGSVFSICIPQEIRSEQKIGDFGKVFKVQQNNEHAYQESFQAPDAKLLAVDDVDMNLEVIKGLLKNTKVQIDTALSGKEALELIQKNTYHLIFMDHMMPEMDGVEVLRQMQYIEHGNKNTPVVVLTANAIIGAEQEYLAEGFTDYLSKPVRVNELESMVRKHLPKELLTKAVGESEGNMTEEVAISGQAELLAGTEQTSTKNEQEQGKKQLDEIEGLDVKTGLMYCMDNEDFYKEMLKSYVNGAKREILEQYYQKEDWENYRIQVHALKSTSHSIGATDISEKALKLEMAAKENNCEYIKEYHAAAMEEYQQMLEHLQCAL